MIHSKKTIKNFIFVFAFAIYWAATFFFVLLPDDGAAIVLNYKYYKKFDRIFFQRWGFFAPPPDFDERLYFTYENVNNCDEKISLEIFESLHKKSKNKYPFNDNEIALDYIIFNTVETVSSLIRNEYRNYEYSNSINSDENICFENFFDFLGNDYIDNPAGKSLINYGRLIAKKMDLPDHYTFQITYTTIPIPKFADRKKNTTRKEKIVFQTAKYNLATNQWVQQ